MWDTEIRKGLVVVLTIGTHSTITSQVIEEALRDKSHPWSSVIPHPLPPHHALVFYSPLGIHSSKTRIIHLWETKNTTEFLSKLNMEMLLAQLNRMTWWPWKTTHSAGWHWGKCKCSIRGCLKMRGKMMENQLQNAYSSPSNLCAGQQEYMCAIKKDTSRRVSLLLFL